MLTDAERGCRRCPRERVARWPTCCAIIHSPRECEHNKLQQEGRGISSVGLTITGCCDRSRALLESEASLQSTRMAASSALVSCLQKDLEDACSAIGSIVSSTTSTSISHAAVAVQRNRDLHLLLQRLLSLHSQSSSIVSAF